jgi:cyclophilin family peptidyl-prolyl cis-trans isomerase/HEAT repeat protein
MVPAVRLRGFARSLTAIAALALLASGCATVPAEPPATPLPAAAITWEQKLEWMIRLEDQRLLRNPNPPAPAVLAAATRNRPAILGPPEPSDLIRLLEDPEARVRRRAALAVGRVGLPEGVEPLTRLLSDAEPEVRQMAAFALGLLADGSARPALAAALADADPAVQGRAAEALGAIGNREDAALVAQMAQVHVRAGVLTPLTPDDLGHPQAAPVEAVRLALYALVRLGDYSAVAATVLDPTGRPVSGWWPVAYALQRLGDPRAEPALMSLMQVAGRFTSAFAIRGLGLIKATAAVAPLTQIVEGRQSEPAVVIQAVRALGAIGDAAAASVLERLALDRSVEGWLRAEGLTAFGTVAAPESVDMLLDLLTDPSPLVRASATRVLARLDPDAFLTALSGLDPDRDWTVRAAQAAALGTLPPERSQARLTLMLSDQDQRVIPAVLAALVSSKVPGVERILTERLAADDFGVRAAAAGGLADLGVTAAVPALMAAFNAPGDSTFVARAAALGALARLDRMAARPVLDQALADREWAVRVRAEALLREQGIADARAERPAPARMLEPAEWQQLVNPSFSPHAFIETDRGTIEIELAILDAPITVANFMGLARKGFYDGVAIHRLVPDFVVQHGDPRGDGEGGPGATIRDEINQRPYLRGTVGMALDWKDTGGSQFFITHSPQPHLDGRYTVFGHVVNGLEVVDALRVWDIVRRVRIWDGVTPQ